MWAVRSPDGDEWVEDVSGGDPGTGPKGGRLEQSPRPGGLPRLYRFRERMRDRGLRAAFARGLRLAQQFGGDVPLAREVVSQSGLVQDLRDFMGTTTAPLMLAVLRRLRDQDDAEDRGADLDGQVPAAPRGGKAVTPEDLRPEAAWLTMEGRDGLAAGTKVSLAVGVDAVFGDRAMHWTGRVWVPVRRVAAEDLGAAAPETGIIAPRVSFEAEVDAERFGRSAESPGGGQSPKPLASDDARTLWVDWDTQGERHKSWKKVCQESRQEEFEDSPFEGGTTTLYMAKAMERSAGDPRSWLDKWLREKKLDPGDRVSHELKILCDALYYAGCRDQLNLGGLTCLEVLSRRVAVIVEAYTMPNKPSWGHAKFYEGVGAAEEVVAPALRAHAFKRAKEEAEIVSSRVKASQRGSPSGDADGGARAGEDDGFRKARGGGKGGGKASGGPSPAGAP